MANNNRQENTGLTPEEQAQLTLIEDLYSQGLIPVVRDDFNRDVRPYETGAGLYRVPTEADYHRQLEEER